MNQGGAAGWLLRPGSSLCGGLDFDASQASAIPATSPAIWPSQETAVEVGRIPLSIPPYPRMQTADKTNVPKVRRNQASEAR